MPQQGPNSKQAYLPWEAYEVVGQALYTKSYPPYTSGAELPHQEKFESEEAEARQRRSFRSYRILSNLLEALKFGKTTAWHLRRGAWVKVPESEWSRKSPAKSLLLADLGASEENEPSSGSLLIEAERLNSYFLGNKQPNLSPWEKPPLKRRGHQGIPLTWATEELLRMEKAGELPPYRDNFRKIVCLAIIERYRQDHRGVKTKWQSLERQLRPIFREVEVRLKRK